MFKRVARWLLRAELDKLHGRAELAEKAALDARQELATTASLRRLADLTFDKSGEWREELHMRLGDAFRVGTAGDKNLYGDDPAESYFRKDIAAKIIYNIIRDVFRGYTVKFDVINTPDSGDKYGMVRIDTINFTNRDYRVAFPLSKKYTK